MIKNTLWIIMFVFFFSIMTLAQENNKRKIDAVKKNTAYLYGDATLQTERNAVRLACDLLKNEIKDWSIKNNISYQQFPEAILTQCADTIIIEKKNHIRAFVYIKIADLSTFLSNDSYTPKSVTPIVAPTSQTHELVDTKPKTQTSSPKGIPMSSRQESTAAKHSNPVLDRLMTINSFYDLKSVIAPLHNQGVISSYGKYSTMKEPAECYLIVYDANGSIKALLGKGRDIRENLKTHKPDNVRNYTGCGAIWFKLAEGN